MLHLHSGLQCLALCNNNNGNQDYGTLLEQNIQAKFLVALVEFVCTVVHTMQRSGEYAVENYLSGRHERAMVRLCAILWLLKIREQRKSLQTLPEHPAESSAGGVSRCTKVPVHVTPSRKPRQTTSPAREQRRIPHWHRGRVEYLVLTLVRCYHYISKARFYIFELEFLPSFDF